MAMLKGIPYGQYALYLHYNATLEYFKHSVLVRVNEYFFASFVVKAVVLKK